MINDRLVLVGVAAMSAVATAGWMRQTPGVVAPQPMAFTAPSALEPQPDLITNRAAYTAPVSRAVYPPLATAPQTVANAGPTRPIERVYDDRRVREVSTSNATKRSTKKSAMIIAGSAAAGAAIGGIAGGGKGAAIGALTGGAGGYVYDRMTKNKNDNYSATDAAYKDVSQRSTKERVAIIVGGASDGEAIVGLAGGGKGAAIGALGGGAAGYIYDRMTKN